MPRKVNLDCNAWTLSFEKTYPYIDCVKQAKSLGEFRARASKLEFADEFARNPRLSCQLGLVEPRPANLCTENYAQNPVSSPRNRRQR